MSALEIKRSLHSLDTLLIKIRHLLAEKKKEHTTINQLLHTQLQKIKTFPNYQHLQSLLVTSKSVIQSNYPDWIISHTTSHHLTPHRAKKLSENDLSPFYFRNLEKDLHLMYDTLQKLSSLPILRCLLVRHFDFKKCVFFPLTSESVFKTTLLDLHNQNILEWTDFNLKNLSHFEVTHDSKIKQFNSRIISPVARISVFLKLEIRNHYYRQLTQKYSSILDSLRYWCEKCPKLDKLSFLSISMLEDNPKILDTVNIVLPEEIKEFNYPELNREKKEINQEILSLELKKKSLDKKINRLVHRNKILSNFLTGKKCKMALRHQTISCLADSPNYQSSTSLNHIHSEKKKILDKELSTTRCLIQQHLVTIKKNKLDISKLADSINQLKLTQRQHEKVYHPKFESEIQKLEVEIDTFKQDIQDKEEVIKEQQIFESKLLSLSDNLALDFQEIQNNICYTRETKKKHIHKLHNSTLRYQERVRNYQSFLTQNQNEIKELYIEREKLTSNQNELVTAKKTLIRELEVLDTKYPELGATYRDFSVLEIIKKYNQNRIELANEMAEWELPTWIPPNLELPIQKKWVEKIEDVEAVSDNLICWKLDLESLFQLVTLFRSGWLEYRDLLCYFSDSTRSILDTLGKSLLEQVVREEKEIQIDFEKFKKHNWDVYQQQSQKNLDNFCDLQKHKMDKNRLLTQEIYRLQKLQDYLGDKKQMIEKLS